MSPRLPRAARLYVVGLLICIGQGAFAAEALKRIVYKCTTAQNEVSYQDTACAKADRETLIAVDIAADSPPPAAAPATPVAPEVAAPAPVPAPPPIVMHKSLPPMWLCTRPEDGTRYLSRNGSPPSRLVPLGILGYPGQNLATVYGPGGGGGVSAPEMSKPTKLPPGGRNGYAKDYTEVQDDCLPASADQTCTYLANELDGVRKKLRSAFKSDRAVLEPREAALSNEIEACN